MASKRDFEGGVRAAVPAKRLRVGDYLASDGDAKLAVESPTIIEHDEEELPINVAPAPIVEDLYLETVSHAIWTC